jgi:cysteinyl-tRNA synthetase
VYPTEVEAVLARHPGIALAAVFGVADDVKGQEVHAAVVAHEGVTLDEDDVIAFVKELDDSILGCLTGEARTAAEIEKKPDVHGEAAVLDARLSALIEARQRARADRNFRLADEIRGELLAAGIVLEDTKDGVRWKSVGPAKP